MKAALLFLLLRTYQTSALSRATVSPPSSQVFEYLSASVNCSPFGSLQWTVWRYTSGSNSVLSRCGSGWGDQKKDSCEINPIKQSDSGVYWCQSKHGDSSNTVNISVVGGDVRLKSPVLPVMPGENVTLHCEDRKSPNLAADFYKDDILIGSEPTGRKIIHSFSRADEGAYKCGIKNKMSSHSWLRMEDGSKPVSLKVVPDSSQLFEYRNIFLSCGTNSSSRGWRIVRAAAPDGNVYTCGVEENWELATADGCDLRLAKPSDSGTYWCESFTKQRSNSINITVHNGSVILHITALPVTVGDNVTLRCRTKDPSEDLKADFYKDGSLVRTEPTGQMTLHQVSTSAEGQYWCHIKSISDGKSPTSWLFVRGASSAPPSTALSVWSYLLQLVVVCLYFVCTFLAVSVYLHKPAVRNLPVRMTTRSSNPDYEEPDQPYDEAIASVTREHHFTR